MKKLNLSFEIFSGIYNEDRNKKVKESQFKVIYYSVVFGSLVVSAFLKISFIESREIWLDEAYSSFLTGKSILTMMDYIKGDIHPPLYHFLLKGWTEIFGITTFTLRSFSILMNIIASLGFFLLVSRIIANRLVRFFCFILFLFSPALFWYSVEVRSYMLGVLFCVLSYLSFLSMIKRNESPSFKAILTFSMLASCLFFTHYTLIFIIIGYFAYYVICVFRKKLALKPIILSTCVIIIITHQWYPVVYKQMSNRMRINYNLKVARMDPNTLNFSYSRDEELSFAKYIAKNTENMASILGVYPFENWIVSIIFGLPFIIIMVYSVYLFIRKNETIQFLLCMIILYMMLSQMLRVSERRFFICLTPFLILIIGIVISEMFEKKLFRYKYLCVILSMIILIFYISGTLRIIKKDYCKPTTDIVSYISKNWEAGDLIIFNNLYYQVIFDYYASQYNFYPYSKGFPISIYDWWEREKSWNGLIITKNMLREFMSELESGNNKNSIWLILFETSFYDPGNRILSELRNIADRFEKCEIGFGKCDNRDEFDKRYQVFKIKIN